MANTRGKDYNKRLNYDELKDKITKTKKPINAPYRTATIVRNSNQMQNLLQMNNFEMEQHQAELEKEQIKQAKVGEVLSKTPQIKEPKKQMKNVSVDATKILKERSTQAGVKTLDTGVNATQQTRSTASGNTEPRVIHNSVQTMDESDTQQDQLDDAIRLLTTANQTQQQQSISQLTASTNLAHQRAVLGSSAADAAMQSGYNFTQGGSSSSGMDQSMGQQKRTPEDEVEPKGKRGRPKQNRGDEVVLVENKSNGNGNGNGNKAKAKPKTKAEKREEKEAQQLTQPETDIPSSKPSKSIPVKNVKAKRAENKEDATTKLIGEGKSRSWWTTQNISVIKAQAELRGRRYEPHETTGKAEGDFVKKYKPFRKKEYLNELYKILGI